MSVASIGWIIGLLTVSAVFFLLRDIRHRQLLFGLCNALFLVSQSLDAYAWVLLVAFLVTGYVVGKILAKHSSSVILVGYLCLIVGIFLVVKQYSFLESVLPSSVFARRIVLVGLSYMLFRQIHFVVDAAQGQIGQLSFWRYLNYQLNLFGLQAGPIQRYQEFSADWDELKPVLTDPYDILRTYLRLFWGVIKVLGLAAICLSTYNTVLDSYMTKADGWRSIRDFMLVLYLFPAYLYFNFSGYCDIVIAGAALMGIRMPENFNNPFVSRNIGELWTRWHRTLGLWIRDYLFNPLFKGTVERWPRLTTPLIFISYLVAFALAGLWHGSTWNFLVFGILNGVGIGCAKAWEMFLVRRRGRAGLRAYLQSPLVKAVAVFGTVHYFSVTLIFWSNDMTKSVAILRRLTSVFLS